MSTLDISTDNFLEHPLAYPGSAPGRSVLLIDRTCLDLRTGSSRRLGQAEVMGPDSSLDKLNAALLDVNAAPVDQRTLVVSIGSNSSLSVMRRKFSKGRVSTTIPIVKAVLRGIAVGHSAHVSNPGYIAAAPFAMPGAQSEVYASLLDDDQMRCLDATEPNYSRLLLDGGVWDLALDSSHDGRAFLAGERPAQFHLFVSRHGVLASSGGAPLRMRSQSDLIRTLVSNCDGFAGLFKGMEAQKVTHQLANDPALRDRVTQIFAEQKWVRAAGIEGAEQQELRYGQSKSLLAILPSNSRLVCCSSSDDLDRRGEQCIVLNTKDAAALGVGTHSCISGGPSPDRPGVIARTLLSDSQPRGTVGVDQVLRNSLGVEVHEHVDVVPARVRSTPIADVLIAKPHYSLLRVQTADLATVEQDVALISPLAMSILGLEGGDEVVLEGPPDDRGDVRQLRLRAHATPDETIDRRTALSGGGLTTRFPSVRASLGVHPDLPWVFIDSAARSRLGVDGHKLVAVRLRAARSYQLADMAAPVVKRAW